MLLAAGDVPLVNLSFRKRGYHSTAVGAERHVDWRGHGTQARGLGARLPLVITLQDRAMGRDIRWQCMTTSDRVPS
jgi:hypothetical protein